ncbi:hypothetical protein ACFW04_000208 [Cataglyphis niger]
MSIVDINICHLGRLANRNKDHASKSPDILPAQSQDKEICSSNFWLVKNNVKRRSLVMSLKFNALCDAHNHEHAVTVDGIQMRWHREISPISPHESLPLRIARPPYNFRVRSHFYFNKAVIFFSDETKRRPRQ